MSQTKQMTTGISFTPTDWERMEIAKRKGLGRSVIIRLALEALNEKQPAIFLTDDYTDVTNVISEEPVNNLQPA